MLERLYASIMKTFLYKAKNSRGQIISGTVKAENTVQAEKVLMNHNFMVMDLSVEKSRPLSSYLATKVAPKDKALFARQLATMLSSGLELVKAIKLTSVQARNDKIRSIYLDLYQEVEEGTSFSEALAKHPEAFDTVFVSVVNAGENTGKLDVVLEQLASQLENDNNFIAKVRGALYYPAFILVALLGIGGYMMVKVIPQLKSIFDGMGSQLPWATKVLVSLSDFMVVRWWLFLLIVAALIIAFRYWFGSASGQEAKDKMEITVPGFKTLFEGMYMYRFSKVMAMLIGAGVPLLDALKISGNTMQNKVYSSSIGRVIEQVEKGVPLSSQLAKEPIFPPLVSQMAAVGEETGQLDLVFNKVASYYEESTAEMIKTISTLIEPIVLVIMGLGVAFLVFAVLVPIYNIAQLQ